MKIDKHVPIPNGAGRGKKIYPYAEMEIGDSVFFEGKNTGSKECTAAHVYGGKYGKKFSGRTVDGGLRIWRVA